MNKRLNTQHTNAGMVSIMVTMIMLLVITLIVLGFAQVSRREQRQQLDRNLSTEAFYAAESGVNDAIDAIRSQPYGTNIEKTSCDVGTNASPVHYLDRDLQPELSGSNVAYTCMLVTTASLTDLPAAVAADGSSQVLPIHPGSGNPLDSIKLTWTVDPAPGSAAACTSGGNFPKATSGNWTCPYGVLRIDLVPTDTLTRAGLDGAQKTVFLYPTNGVGGAVAYASMDGTAQPMKCNGAACTEQITLPASGPVNYAIRAMAIYKPGNLDVQGIESGSPQLLKDAQAQIDVTGRAQDVLRRIQVRIPLLGEGTDSNYAIESAGSICKRFSVGVDTFDIPGSIAVKDLTNPMCIVSSAAPPPPPPGPGPAPKGCKLGYDVLLVMDHSGSMYDHNLGTMTRITKLQQVMRDFVSKTNVGPLAANNNEGIMWFAGGPDVLFYAQSPGQILTGNVNALLNSINSISEGTGTMYYPPLALAQSDGWSAQNGGRAGHPKVLVFVTDGFDDQAGDEVQAIAVAQQLRQSNVTIYSVAISDVVQNYPGLMAIANQPSGTYFTDATQESDLQNMFDRIAAGVQCK